MIIDGIRVSLDENIGNDWEVKERKDCGIVPRKIGVYGGSPKELLKSLGPMSFSEIFFLE